MLLKYIENVFEAWKGHTNEHYSERRYKVEIGQRDSRRYSGIPCKWHTVFIYPQKALFLLIDGNANH